MFIAALFFGMLLANLHAQTLDQQFRETDAELNRAYQSYRVGLPEDQKAALKIEQLQWLAGLEEALKTKQTATEKLQLRIAWTVKRVAELNKMRDSGRGSHGELSGLTPQQVENRNSNISYLKKADEELNAAYKQALSVLTPPEQARLRQEQRDWLAQTSGGIPFEKHRNILAAIGLLNARTFQLKTAAEKAAKIPLEQATVTFAPEFYQSAPVLVTPQGSMIDRLDSISTSSDGRLVCLVGQKAVEIWSVEDNSLLHSLNLPCDFARLLPDQAVLLGVGQRAFSSDATYTGSEARRYPSRLTGVSLLSRQQLFSCDLGLKESERIPIMKPWRKGYFISNDGAIVVEQYLDSTGDDLQEAFAVCLSPSVSLSAGKAVFFMTA